MIYLDNAATTRVDPEVLEAMLPYLRDQYGNPGSLHVLGQEAAKAVQTAREQVADLIHASPNQILFTSGGTEANNLALAGVSSFLRRYNTPDLLISGTEHDSVIETAESLRKYHAVSYLSPEKDGTISVQSVRAQLSVCTGLVSVMHTNNETGAENPVQEIGRFLSRKDVLFHVDCVQAAGFSELDVNKLHCDLLSLSSHKIHGPKGVGALYVRAPEILMSPIIRGGKDQEFGLRGGTENVPGIVGFGKACALAAKRRKLDAAHISECKLELYTSICEGLFDRGEILHSHGPTPGSPGKILNLGFDGVDAQTLVLLLSSMGVYASAGSACRSHEMQPSRVLTAMGLSDDEARSSLRFSLSRENTLEEMAAAGQIIAQAVRKLLG